jgi:hypothetical protein
METRLSSPKDVRELASGQKRASRNRGKTAIITSSPYKKDLELQPNKKPNKTVNNTKKKNEENK